MEPTTIAERLAMAMAKEELQPKFHSLADFLCEVHRVWRRYIPEAESLIDRMRDTKLAIVEVD